MTLYIESFADQTDHLAEAFVPEKYCIFSLKIDLILSNSADPDEMPHFSVFHLVFSAC